MKRLDRFWLKCLGGLLLVCMLTANFDGNRAVYAKDQESNKELTPDVSDTLQSDEETKAQEAIDSSAKLPVDEKTEQVVTDKEANIKSEELKPLARDTIEITIWRGTGGDEKMTLTVGEKLLSQLGPAPEMLTNPSGVSVLCEGWQMDGSLIAEGTLVEESMDGKRISPKPHRHTWISYDEVAATCEEDGWTGGQYCSYGRCGIENPDNPRQVDPAKGHDWEDTWTTDDPKVHYHSCKNGCGARKDEVAHTPGPAATADTAQTCIVCGHVLVIAHAHDASTVKEVGASVATCTEPAKIAHYECTVDGCGKYFADTNGTQELTLADITSAPALGHKFGEWTDIGNGKQERTCSVCNAKEERNKPAVVPGGNNGNQGNSGSSSHKSSGSSSSTGTTTSVVNTVSPQTDDASNAFMWAALMLLSAVGAAFCISKRNKAA